MNLSRDVSHPQEPSPVHVLPCTIPHSQTRTLPVPTKPTKSNLPSKDCVVCGRPFEWRKKWERCWDEVRYCSERCRRR